MSTYSAPDRSRLEGHRLTTKPFAPMGVGRTHARTDDWSPPAKFGRRHPTVDRVGKATAPDRTATYHSKSLDKVRWQSWPACGRLVRIAVTVFGNRRYVAYNKKLSKAALIWDRIAKDIRS